MQKNILITGSSRGIGRATALRLALDGWNVVLHCVNDLDAAHDVAEEIGPRCLGVIQADLADTAQVERLWQQASSLADLTALVNNAGIYTKTDFINAGWQQFEEDFALTFQVNFHAPRVLIYHACRHFASSGAGKVVNICSRVAHRGEAGASAYSTSKAALLNLTRALAVEHAELGIKHYALAPGWVETAMAREGMETRLPAILRDIPLGRMATPSDCAGAVAYLLNPEADYLSGIVIDINGASYLR